MPKITGDLVEQAVLAFGVLFIVHHDCAICGEYVGYRIFDSSPYFDGNCDCSMYRSQPRPCDWQDIADWINQQPDSKRNRLLRQIGIETKQEAA